MTTFNRLFAGGLLLSVFFYSTAGAVLRPADPRIEKARLFLTSQALDDGRLAFEAANRNQPTTSLGSAKPAQASRGALVAQTWRDWMANSTIGRTVDFNPPSSGSPGVQFSYMEKSSAYSPDHTQWGWAAYDATTGSYVAPGGAVIVQNPGPGSVEAGAYPKICIDATGCAFIAGHDFPDQDGYPNVTQMHTVHDYGPFAGYFGDILSGSVMSETVRDNGSIGGGETIWPTMDVYENGPVSTVYLAAYEYVSGFDGAMKVFRKVGWNEANPDATWSLVFSDTSFFPTQDISCSRVSSRVGVAWTKFTPAGRSAGNTRDNDVWIAISPTGASGTWVRTNITNYSGAGNRAWVEVSTLYDSSDKFHVVWNGLRTDGQSFTDRRCRLFHWSEFSPSNIYTIFDANWDPSATNCTGGSNVMNVGHFSIGECDGRLYTIFTAWNWPGPDGTNPVDDCCAGAPVSYAANGELYLSVSSTQQGQSWDVPRNLSSTYEPNCSAGTCADDRWGSISRYGMNDVLYSSSDWSNAMTFDFGTGYTGTQYLQVWYETDRYPGGGILPNPQGPLTNNDMRWIRLACISQIPAALLIVVPYAVAYPEFTKPGVPKNYSLTLENAGNTMLTMNSITAIEDSSRPAAPSGWMGYSGAPATIIPASTASMTLQLNKSGVVSSGPTRLFGRLRFNYGPPAKNLDLPIEFTVADTIVNTNWDSITTQCGIRLTVATNGNMGNNYRGGANMGFPQPSPECDTNGGNLGAGDAAIYLGDASPVILRKPGPSTYIASWAIFSDGFASPNGFKPLNTTATRGSFGAAGWDGFNSGTFCTVDSLVKIEKTWWAPSGASGADSCKFIIQRMRIFPYTIGTSVTNLAIGEVFDFDIPSDTGPSFVGNLGGFDATRRLVYMRGFSSSDTAFSNDACYPNGRRYAGAALIMMHMKNCVRDSILYGAYNAANDSFVYPASGFIPEQLWANMQVPGYSTETRITDLHSVLAYKNVASTGYTLPANDTLTIYTAIAVVRPNGGTSANGLDSLKNEIAKARKWYKHSGVKICPDGCCVDVVGNINGTSIVDLADLSSFISYFTNSGFVLPCRDEADLNGDGRISLIDISMLVDYLTGGCAGLRACSVAEIFLGKE